MEKNILQLLTRLQFDNCYVFKTRIGFEIAEITRFLVILAATHILFKIVINLKILENSQHYIIAKLTINKTVKCEVISVEFLSRDLPLNNSAIMVKWKCLKLLYPSKGMCRIDSQLKNLCIWNI